MAQLSVKPPDLDEMGNSGKPPDLDDNGKPIEEESTFHKIARTALTPLVDVNPAMRERMGEFEKIHPVLGWIGRNLTDMVTSGTSPVGIGLTGTAGVANIAERAGLEGLAKVLHLPGKIASGGMMVHGGARALNPDSGLSTGDRLSGLLEAGLGAYGLQNAFDPNRPKMVTGEVVDAPLAPEPKLPKLLGPAGSSSSGFGPRFIGGDAGVADVTQPHAIDLGPIGNPRFSGQLHNQDITFGSADQGTILPRELEGLNPIPPDLAARNGLTIGKLTPYNKYSEPAVPEKLAEVIEEPEVRLPSETYKLRLPEEAKTTSGGVAIGADIKSLGKVLGSSLYSGDISKIATKELLQNSIDAVRSLGGEGRISVSLQNSPRSVEVTDNGPGLTKEQLQTIFSDLGSSGKRDDASAIGGFGLAKAAPLLGGEKVEVTSVAREPDGKLLKHSFSGTPDDLLSGVEINSEEVPHGTPTGIAVKTFVKENADFYSANEFVENAAKYSDIDHPVDLTYYGRKQTIPPNKLLSKSHITTLDSPGATIEIAVPHDSKYDTRSGVDYYILNNGMYQTGAHTGGYEEIPNIPEDVLVNIKSKVPEGDSDYPFTANRESLRGSAQETINKYLNDVIVKTGLEARKKSLTEAYDKTPAIQLPNKKLIHVYDVGQKYGHQEMRDLTESPQFNQLSNALYDTLHHALRTTGKTDWLNAVERVGLILDEKVRGIHIPSPVSGKSMILINPFELMRTGSPDSAAAGFVHTILHELAHVEGGGHNESFAVRLADITQAYGAKNAYLAGERFRKGIANPENPELYSDEISGLLQDYITARGRKETIDDPLRRTGIESAVKSEGRGGNDDDIKSSAADALGKLLEAIKSSKPLEEQQRESYREERGERLKEVGAVKDKGIKGFRKQLSALRGKYEKVEPEPLVGKISARDTDNLIRFISANRQLSPFEQIRTKSALLKILENKTVPQHNELALLEKVFGAELPNAIVEMHGGFREPITRTALAETAGIAKTLKSGLDVSGSFRQNLGLIFHPEFWKAYVDQYKYAGDIRAFKAAQEALKERPLASFGIKSGLSLTGLDDKYENKEENYPSKIIVRGRFNPLGASERAFVGMSNAVRAGVFDKLVLEAGQTITDQKEMEKVGKQIASFVNEASGRGSLDFSSGKPGSVGNFEKAAVELNAAFYSPRLISSRVRILGKMLQPSTYTRLSPMVRREYLKTLIAVGGFGSAMTYLAHKLGGAIVDMNPTSADFGKARFKNTRADFYGGFQQYVVALAKIAMQKETSTTSGTSRAFGSKPMDPNMFKVADQFRRNKMSPMAAIMEDWARGSNAVGEPWQSIGNKDQTGREIKDMFMNMLVQDVMDVYKDDPDKMKAFLAGLAAAHGVGIQTYGNKPQLGLRPNAPLGTLKELH